MVLGRTMSFLALVMSSLFAASNVGAQSTISSEAVDKATRFLESRATAEYALGFLHFGATYEAHSKVGVAAVKDSSGRVIPGEFAMVYRYRWDAAGSAKTTVAFLCDRRGNIEDVQVLDSTAVLHQPFQFAQASVEILGSLMVEAFKSQMTEDDQRVALNLIRNSNVEGLLELGLRFRQAAGMR